VGVDRIGLGQLSRRPADIAHLSWIGHHDRHAGRSERGDHGVFKAAGCLEDRQRRSDEPPTIPRSAQLFGLGTGDG
jgi:hypothetical protein